MKKAIILTLCLFVALADKVQSDDVHSSFYGVKLCGREFIRAVIFTCGGSRWRRSTGDTALIREENLNPWNTNSIHHLSSNQEPAEPQTWMDQTLDVGTGYSRSARSAVSDELLEALRSEDRKGRDVVIGLSNACCKWGCSKSEISSLC
ncbi:relaxin-3b [Gouania willdenowi]|uniref:Relaxin-3 n=1 Tax=Gouania willdenowi TaxID=441366 RepID=A0A8C5DV49_GOUWI|nr:relaxin-3 [Gouania willdenowi]